jgi:hydroxyacylglutathione hydrolase
MKIQTFTFNPFQENTYVVSTETGSAVIIDPGCYDRSEQEELRDYIRREGFAIKGLWNTHCHIDHVLGNAFVAETWGVPLLAHREELFTLGMARRSAEMYGMAGYVDSPEPTIFVEDGQILELDDERFRVIFGPGHCVGHVAFYSEDEKVLLGGDILFKGSFGRTDLPGGDMETLKRTIHNRIFTLPEDTVVYPGHGPTTTIGEEKRSNYIWQF